MFFHLSTSSQDNFPNHYKLGSFSLDTDSGWSHALVERFEIIYKGYADQSPLADLLLQIATQEYPTIAGNFCAIVYDTVNCLVKICTSKDRSFPLYFQNGVSVNNLVPTEHVIWANNQITIAPGIYLSDYIFDHISELADTELEFDQVVNRIDEILSTRTKQFLSHNTRPIRVFLSGGVDSMLVYSYIKRYTDCFELVKCQHVDYDYFWLMNAATLKEFWGYKQIHHWVDPCILTSGAPGDEFMLRSPVTAGLYLRARGIDILEELKNRPNCLHKDYFELSKHVRIFQAQQNVTDTTNRQLCDIVANDWQHWHLGNTLTWTPLRDLEIFKTILRLPLAHALDQIYDSALSYALIERNCPGLTSAISDSKNTGNMQKNLIKLFF